MNHPTHHRPGADARCAGGPPMQRAERRAAPKPARIPGPVRGPLVARGDRATYPSPEGQSLPRAERRAAPKPARIPPGDRATYPSPEGQS